MYHEDGEEGSVLGLEGLNEGELVAGLELGVGPGEPEDAIEIDYFHEVERVLLGDADDLLLEQQLALDIDVLLNQLPLHQAVHVPQIQLPPFPHVHRLAVLVSFVTQTLSTLALIPVHPKVTAPSIE